MFKRTKRFIIAFIFIMISACSAFALEEYVVEIYKQIDACFSAKSEDKLYSVLSKNTKDKYYYLIENYTQKKIRRLIVNNEYDFAMSAILAVIENNLDNEEAVEMYSVISDAYEIQRKYEAEIEHQKELERARIEMEKEKQRGNVEKEYVAATKTSGGSVYVSGKETKLTSYNWKLAFGIADVLSLIDLAGDISSFHYGASADFRYEYTLENKTVIGTDIFAGFQFLGFAEPEKLIPMIGDVEADFKIAFPKISNNLFFRVGFEYLMAGKSETATKTHDIVDKFYSPVVGIKMERIKLGSAKLDLGAEWLAGHLFNNNVKMAAGGSLNIEVPFAELEKVKLNFNVGARNKFLMKETGIENRASVILAIGVENVIR